MKVLLINGSPRPKGNTAALTDLLEGILRARGAVPSRLDLRTAALPPCSACDACQGPKGAPCVHGALVESFLGAVAAADAVVFLTPVYWWGVSAQTKSALDHFHARTAAFQTLAGKRLAVIATGADTQDNPQYRLIREQFACIAEFLNWTCVEAPAFSAEAPGDVLKDPTLQDTLAAFADALCR